MMDSNGFAAASDDASALGSTNAEAAEASANSTALLPCPFCDSRDVRTAPDYMWCVLCEDCQTEGPAAETEAEAEAAWNRRGRLITAAPDLLAALVALADAHEATIAGDGYDAEFCDCPALDLARAALAKATPPPADGEG